MNTYGNRSRAHAFLASLREGERVTLTRDGRTVELKVMRELRRMDGSGFGSWDHSAVTVGYGVGHFATEITAAGLADGRYALERAS